MGSTVENLDDINIIKESWLGREVGETLGTITYLGHNGLNKGKKKGYVFCSECAKDKELYPTGIFIINPPNIKKLTYKPSIATMSSWQIDILIDRICVEKGYKFHGFVNNEDAYKTNSNLKLSCSNGHYWESTKLTKLINNRGCPYCANNVTKTLEQVLKDFNDKHGGLYDYSLITEFKSTKQKLPIICKEHGVFYSDYHHHAQRGQGCPHPECAWKKISEVKASTTEEFIRKAKLVHGDKYDYSNTVYDRSFKPVNIHCNTCGEDFTQIAGYHLDGNGCQSCAGRNQLQCYIFNVFDNTGEHIAIKVGIANIYTSRLQKQNRDSIHNVVLYGVWEYSDHTDCTSAESKVKESLNNGYLSKEEYADGYSETFPISDLDKAVEILEKYNGKRINVI